MRTSSPPRVHTGQHRRAGLTEPSTTPYLFEMIKARSVGLHPIMLFAVLVVVYHVINALTVIVPPPDWAGIPVVKGNVVAPQQFVELSTPVLKRTASLIPPFGLRDAGLTNISNSLKVGSVADHRHAHCSLASTPGRRHQRLCSLRFNRR